MSNIQPSGLPQIKLPRNYFDWRKKHISSYQSGYIYPVWSRYVTPNSDTGIKISAVIRRLPTIAPSFAEERAVFRIFSVPLRVLFNDWQAWLTGYKEYSDNVPYEGDVPRWTPSNINKTNIKSLWAHLGHPVNCIPTISPANFKQQAYGFICDTNFRYRPIEESILDEGKPGTWKGEDLLRINKDRDYFTTMLPQQQLGEPVSLPITGDASAVWDEALVTLQGQSRGSQQEVFIHASDNKRLNFRVKGTPIQGQIPNLETFSLQPASALADQNMRVEIPDSDVSVAAEVKDVLNKNKVTMNNISSATISMIRHAFARQLQAENLARSGVFYPDVIMMNYGDAPSDDILGLPKYHGGFTVNLVNSEVLQTAPSTDNSPLGEMGGHGLGVGENSEITIHVNEHSVIMVLMYIKSENFYNGQQYKNEDLFESNEQMKWVAYNHLSEQPVKKQEILCVSKNFVGLDDTGNIVLGSEDPSAKKYNEDVFGFQPIYEDYRSDYNTVGGLLIREQFYDTKNWKEIKFRNNLYNWANASIFSIKDGERPAFNKDFLQYKDDMRNYAVVYKDIAGTVNEDQFLIWFDFDIAHYAVLDKYGAPGQMDNIGVI